MAQIDKNTRETNIRFVDDATGLQVNINNSILTMQVSYTMDMASQITLTVHDSNFDFARNNFFHITRTVFFSPETLTNYQDTGIPLKAPELAFNDYQQYRAQIFEIASAQVAQGPSLSAVWTIELRPKAVQQMKRDRNPKSYKGKGSEFARSVCTKFSLMPLIEYTQKSAAIQGASGDRVADSVWDVLSNIASEAKFVVFETDNTLVFASQKFLLGIYGSENGDIAYIDPQTNEPAIRRLNFIPLNWPPKPYDLLRPLAMPTVRKSDNDPLDVRGSVSLERLSATTLRPGMTVYLQGIPYMDGLYLIDSVDYDYLGTGPVNISFRSPEREKQYIRDYEIGKIYQPLMSTQITSGNV